MNATATKPTSNGTTASTTTPSAAAATQACYQGANDAFKAGVEAQQNIFNAWTKAWNVNTLPTMPFGTVGMGATNLPAMFEKATKSMETMVDSTARYTTELNTLAIDAMRNNARTAKRAGELVVAQMTGKTTKPVAETTREICDEAMSFVTTAGERVMKMNADAAQRVSTIIDEAAACTKA